MKKNLTRYISILLLILSAILIYGSCTLVWDDYVGVNLIADRGFNSAGGDGTLQWKADRPEAYYMNFEHPAEAEALVTDGLPAGTAADDIYRLEIPNLLPNGDFESSTDSDGNGTNGVQPQNWSKSGGTFGPATSFFYEVFDSGDTPAAASAAQAIYGNTLYFTTTADDQIFYDLSALADGFIADSTYTVRFELRTNVITNYEYSDGTTTYLSTPWIFERAETLTDTRTFPPALLDPQFTARSGDGYFSIGLLDDTQAALQSGYIDNLRIVRSNISSYAYILIPAEGTGAPTPRLIDGTYAFSVYVKQDPTNTTGDAPENNRMPVTAVSLCAGYRAGENGNRVFFDAPAVFSPDPEGADWSQWTQVTAYIDLKLSQVYSGDTVYLELMIAPTDSAAGGANRDAGSVLIAAPYLEFLPGGEPAE